MVPVHRRPFLLLQALGAANDNLVKQATLVLIGFGLISFAGSPSLWTNLASGLFILPFLVFSTYAGAWVARTDLKVAIIWVKNLEIGCAVLAGLGLWLGRIELLLLALACLGIQSTLFGPTKFTWPARTEAQDQLPSVTGSIEALTFIAILVGSLVGGALVSMPGVLAGLVISLALLGRVLAQRLPAVPASSVQSDDREDSVDTRRARRLISWFWFLGASYLTQLPLLAEQLMELPPEGVSWLLAAFAVGVGLGSKCVNLIGPNSIRIGFIGLIVFGLGLPWLSQLSLPLGIAALAALGVFGGLYVVPLYVWMQRRLAGPALPTAIGRNNRLNAVFMVASAGFGILTLAVIGLSAVEYFSLMALLSLPWWGQIRAFADQDSGS